MRPVGAQEASVQLIRQIPIGGKSASTGKKAWIFEASDAHGVN
jgi:hypothetical protein